MKSIHKILILRFSSLGDIVMATAMVRCVRQAYPQAQIDMVVREDFLDLIRRNPHLDNKIGLPRKSGLAGLRKLLKQLNEEHYDLVYDAHRSLRTAYLLPLLQAPHKVSLHKPYLKRSLALTFKLPLLEKTRMLSRFVAPLEPFGVKYDGRGPEIVIGDAARKTVASRLPGSFKTHQPEAGELLIGIIPSAQWEGKRWPLSHFRDLLSRLLEKTPHRLVVLGGPADTFCTSLCRGLPESRVFNAQGLFSLEETGALLDACHLVVANDTGLMHMADALGVPPVLFLGPTSAELGCLPFHPYAKVLERQLWCRPCSKNGQAPCIRGNRACLEWIAPQEAMDAIERLAFQLGET